MAQRGAPIHFDISDSAWWRTACNRGRPNARGTNLTNDPTHVTCRSCLTALGYDIAPDDQLTVCRPDPLLRAA